MKKFEEQKFEIPELIGISKENIEEHLKLYSGYVKHANLILEKIEEYQKDSEKNPYVLGELQRRFGFEFDGMRNHEYYFKSLSFGPKELNTEGLLYKKIVEDFGSFESFISSFKAIAMTRGVGWAMLYFDKKTNRLLNAFVEEQQMGHLTGLSPILTLDMWEHSYVFDYKPSGKKNYIEDFFKNLNWQVVEENFK
jgi:Fe-Mn family superoxide dismutase